MLLGELLIRKKLITEEQLNLALEEQRITSDFLGAILIAKRYIREEDLLEALSEQFNIPYVQLRLNAVDWQVSLRFNKEVISEHRCLPIREDENTIWIAITNPLDAFAISESERLARPKSVRLVLVSTQEMNAALDVFREKAGLRLKRSLE